MTATVRDQVGCQDASPAGRLGPQAALEGPEGTPLPRLNGIPQPPAPPPAPRRHRLKRLGQFADKQPIRYQLAIGGVLVLASTVAFTRLFVPPPQQLDPKQLSHDAAVLAVNEVRAQLSNAKAESTQIAVAMPFSWAKCPLSNEAKVMIGGDPATGGKTINAERAAPLDEQAATLLQSFRMVDLRLVAVSQSRMQVVADSPTSGVRLFNCTGDASEAPPPSLVQTPQDPMPPTTVAS